MPLRDHFRPPLDDSRLRDELHGALPTLPLWLAEKLAVPLEVEAPCEETRRILRIQ
jgi:hypothetical protein